MLPLHLTAPWLLLAASGAGYGARYFSLRGARSEGHITPVKPDSAAILLYWQKRYGYNAHSLVSIAPEARVWTSKKVAGAISFGEYGRFWLAAGDPLAADEDLWPLAQDFLRAARERGKLAAFVPATERFALTVAPSELRAVKVGAAPYFDLTTWNPRGNNAKKLRSGLNQARRASISVQPVAEISESLRQEMLCLSGSWLAARRAGRAFGWLFALDPLRHAPHKKFFLARDSGGQLVGWLAASPMPARDGWYLEDVLRAPDAPPGTAEVLVYETLRSLAAGGYKLATLGTSPLAPDGPETVPDGAHPALKYSLNLAYRRLTPLYNFAGLRRFKAKFAPSWWESEYAVAPAGAAIPPQVVYAVLRAVLNGSPAKRNVTANE